MELIQPWQTTIAKVSFGDVLDYDKMLDELLAWPGLDRNTIAGCNLMTAESCPALYKFIQAEIGYYVKEYIQTQFQREVNSLRMDSWALLRTDGKGLEPHLHSGTGLLTTVFYVTDAKAELVLVDPRGNALRGMPPDVRQNHFGHYRIRPKQGDLIIFPCYLEHYVAPGPEEMRLSVLSDCYFT